MLYKTDQMPMVRCMKNEGLAHMILPFQYVFGTNRVEAPPIENYMSLFMCRV